MTTTDIRSPKIKKLYEDLQLGKMNELELFWEDIEKNGAPLIEKIEDEDGYYFVTLIWRAIEQTDCVGVIGEAFGMDTDDTKFEKLLDTELWFRTYKLRGDASSVYLLLINEGVDQSWEELDFRLDPLNPNKYVCIDDEKRPNEYYLMKKEESYMALPEYRENEWAIERTDISRGKVELIENFESHILKNKRRIWVYTPAGYEEKQLECGLAVFTDGWEYMNVVKANVVLDNLIAEEKIDPICAVFIESLETRDTELTCSEEFDDFLKMELLTFLNENYRLSKAPEKNILIGFSYGGLTSAYVGLRNPELFKKVFSHSGGFAFKAENSDKPEIMKVYEAEEKKELDFYLTFGEFEKDSKEHYEAQKTFVKLLEDKGYNFEYDEFMGGHTYTDINIHLAKGIMHLLGKKNA